MRFYGNVGFYETVEARSGDWEPKLIVKKFKGDVLNSTWKSETGDKVNDNLNITNRISIISNPYAYRHLDGIKYVEWSGVKWKVTSVEINRPRLILTIGGVWNGEDS